jgi:hypothetical protein
MSEQSPPPPPRPVLDLSGGQAADLSIGQAAGHSITNQGADATAVLVFLRDYVFKADQVRETAIKEVRGELGMVSDALRGVRNQLNDLTEDIDKTKQAEVARLLADFKVRRWRQFVLNVWLGLITVLVALMAVGWLLLLWRLWPQLTPVALALGGAR